MNSDIRSKLGLTSEMDTYFLRVPFEYWQAVGTKPQPYDDNVSEYDFIHAFFETLDELENFIDVLISKSNGSTIIWISFNSLINVQDLENILTPHSLSIKESLTLLDKQTFKVG